MADTNDQADTNNQAEANNQKNKKASHVIKIILFILFNAAIVGYTAFSEFGKGKSGAEKFRNIKLDMIFLIGAVGCFIVAVAAETFKYFVVMHKICGKASFKTSLGAVILGRYYDNIFPSGIGGHPFQIFYLKNQGLEDGPSIALPVVGFMSMQFAFAIIAVFIFIFNGSVVDSTALKIAAYFGLFLYLLFPFTIIFYTVAPKAADKLSTKIINGLAKIHIVKNPAHTIESAVETIRSYRNSIMGLAKYKHNLILQVMLPALLYEIALCSMPWFVVSAFGAQMSWFDSFSVSVYIYAAITFFPTPGNSGAAEGTFYLMFSSLTQGYIFWAMLVWRFLCYYIFLIMGISYYALRAFLRRRMNKKTSELS